MTKVNSKKKLRTIQEFIGKASMNENYSGSSMVFGDSIDGNSVVLANVGGIQRNISRRVGSNEYDSEDVSKFTYDLTKFIVEAINEKLERDESSKIVCNLTI